MIEIEKLKEAIAGAFATGFQVLEIVVVLVVIVTIIGMLLSNSGIRRMN